jgi:hypothetical protein
MKKEKVDEFVNELLKVGELCYDLAGWANKNLREGVEVPRLDLVSEEKPIFLKIEGSRISIVDKVNP